jgi:NAD(P)H-dependent FMN reductase
MPSKVVKVKASTRNGKVVKAHVRKISVTLQTHPMDGSVFATWKGKKAPIYKNKGETYEQFKKRIKTKLEAHVESKKPKKVTFKEDY